MLESRLRPYGEARGGDWDRGVGCSVCPSDSAASRPPLAVPAYLALDSPPSRSSGSRLEEDDVSHPAHHTALDAHQGLLAACACCVCDCLPAGYSGKFRGDLKLSSAEPGF